MDMLGFVLSTVYLCRFSSPFLFVTDDDDNDGDDDHTVFVLFSKT